VFLPRDAVQREKVQGLVATIVGEEGQRLLGWRDVPTDDRLLGASALNVEPTIKQVFIGRGGRATPPISSASSTSSASASSTPWKRWTSPRSG